MNSLLYSTLGVVSNPEIKIIKFHSLCLIAFKINQVLSIVQPAISLFRLRDISFSFSYNCNLVFIQQQFIWLKFIKDLASTYTGEDFP